MIIAITAQGSSANAQVDPRFGRAKQFLIYDSDADSYKILDNSQALNAPQGAGTRAAGHVINSGATVLLTGHCGPNAFLTLQAEDIQIVSGVSGVVQDAVERFLRGELKPTEAADVEGHW